MVEGPRWRVAGAVLAAGDGSRMGTPKGELVVNDERLVDRAVRVVRAAGCQPVLAIVRAGTQVPDARVVINPDPARGLRSSLVLAVDEISADGGVDAFAVLLADLPGVGADAIRTVVEAWRPGRIGVGSYAGRRGHPTVMSPALWREAVSLAEPDEGAKRLLATRPELVDEIEVDGDPADLDTPQDLRRWTAR